MKNKLSLLLIIALMSFGGVLQAQMSQDCKTNMSIFSENAKVKNYDVAYELLQKLRAECPTSYYALYQYGERILKDKIDNAGDVEKKAFAEDLVKLYEEKQGSFPDKTKVGENISEIAEVMYDNDLGSKMDQYKKFNEAWTTDKETFVSASALYKYFNLAVDLQSTAEIELQEVFDLYDVLQEKITSEQNNYAKRLEPILEKKEAGESLNSAEQKTDRIATINLENYAKVASGIDGKLGKLADCDNLVPLYQKDYEEKKGDLDWIKRAAGRLSGKDCTSDPLFTKLVEQLDKLEPSANTAMYLGQLASQNGNSSKALQYYKESADRQTDPDKKGKVYFKIAESYRKSGSYGTARTYYQKTLEQIPSFGYAYLQIASMYASSANNCGNTVFEKRAVYWLAADMAERAGRVNPALKSNASQTAVAYRAKAPDRTMIFNDNMGGKRITFNCWIGGGVTVPNL